MEFSTHKTEDFPQWFQTLKSELKVDQDGSNASTLRVKEWDDEASRAMDGFKGVDFCHGSEAAVRIMSYVLIAGSRCSAEEGDSLSAENGPTSTDSSSNSSSSSSPLPRGMPTQPRLVAPVHFTPRAESGRGYCHGGSMCAVMDDAVGWMGFCASGEVRPWAGYTVQVDTSLKKSVPVGAVLRLDVWIDRLEGRRKVWIGCRLSDPEDPTVVHCEGKGLFLHATGTPLPTPSSSPAPPSGSGSS